jgi:hypothetical protein
MLSSCGLIARISGHSNTTTVAGAVRTGYSTVVRRHGSVVTLSSMTGRGYVCIPSTRTCLDAIYDNHLFLKM